MRVLEGRSQSSTAHGVRWSAFAVPLVTTLLVQALIVAYTFPISELLTPTPILYIDHPFHLYELDTALELAARGQLAGYDPYFGAGYVGGITYNASARGPALLAWLLSGAMSYVVTYKIFLFVVSATAPAAVAVAAVMARRQAREVWIAGGLAIGLWWASEIHWYYTAGMASFVAASYFAIPFCVLVDRALDMPRAIRTVVLIGALAALLFLLHPFFVIPAVIFVAVRLALSWPSTPFATLVTRLTIISAIALAANLPWILAMHADPGIASSKYSIPYQAAVDSRLVWADLLGLNDGPAKGAKANLLLFVLALISLRESGKRRTLDGALIGSWLGLVLFAAFGAALPFIGPVQPNRFASSAYLFLVLPATAGSIVLARAMRNRRGAPRAALACITVALGALALLVLNEVRREASYGDVGRYGAAPPQVQGLGPKGRAVLSWLRSDTSSKGRVLFETSLARVHDGGHIVGYLATLTKREFIGGPYNNFFAGTRDGWMFGRDIGTIDRDSFLAYLRLYNIGWIVVHSKAAKDYLHRFGSPVEAEEAFEGLETFVVQQPLSFVAKGQGRVREVGFGRLVIENDGAIGDSMILKYHYVPGLHANDGSLVEPQRMLDDPDPFIRLTPRSPIVELAR